MIDILVGDDPTGLGVATALAIEGIPAGRIIQPTAAEGSVVVGYRSDAAAAPLGSQARIREAS